jgi:hypothetical protein
LAIPSVMSDLSVTAASNFPAGTEAPSNADDFFRAIQAILRTTNAKGSDIASAATTDIGAATGEFVDVTGTTTITALGTIAAGIVRTVRFTGALTLTHNATSLILPGSANITTANGDCAQFRSLGSGNWKCVNYMYATSPYAASGVNSDITGFGFLAAAGDIIVATADNAMTRAGMPYGFSNASLTSSVGASALTIALKGTDGNDPSATNPVYFSFPNASLLPGTPVTLAVTAASSLVVSSGSTLGTSNGVPFRLWVVGFNDAGTFRLGVVQPRSGNNLFPLANNRQVSSVAEGGAGGADSALVMYTGTAVTSKSYVVIGYLEFESGQATAGTWASNATYVHLQGPRDPLPGETVRFNQSRTATVATGTTTIPADNTIPQNTEGDQYMTISLTPTAFCNLIEITAQGVFANSAATGEVMALFQDSTANALAATAQHVPAGGNVISLCLEHTMLANTVSSTTFAIRAGGNGAGTTTFNGSAGAQLYGGVSASFIKVREIMG